MDAETDGQQSETGVAQRFTRVVAVLRGVAIGTGLVLVLLATLAPAFAARLVVGGIALILLGSLARFVADRYRTGAVIVLNTLVLMAAAELSSTVLLAVANLPSVKGMVARVTGQPNDLMAHYASLPFYAREQWAERHWREFETALKKTYHPYVVWRSPAFAGETINIGEDGIRYTPGAECAHDSYEVFVFGGSAMWGWGAPDWGTIAAHLQQELGARVRRPVCVTNYAEQAFVSTQSVIQLMLELERGHVPDVVVFYDGVNEVLAASQTRRPILHQNFTEIAARFEGPRHPALEALAISSTFQLLRLLASHLGRAGPDPLDESGLPTEELVSAVVDAYLANLRIVSALAREHGFERHFFWQPYLLVGAKPLTDEEQRMIRGLNWVLNLDGDLADLFRATYLRVGIESRRTAGLHDLTDVFADQRSQLWIDTWGHVTPEGNRVVARRIANVIEGGRETRD